MRLLVTGGAGFIGSYFVRQWLANHPEDKVVVLDALTYAGHLENLKTVAQNPNFEFKRGDIRVKNDVDGAMAGVDVVVHFAAESHVDRSIVGPTDFATTNVDGTLALLQSATENRVRLFHHVSTDEVFGSLPLDRPDVKFNEDTPYHPHSPYSASKAASDHFVRAYFDTYGLPITITNTSNNYGPNQDPEKFIPRSVTNLLVGEKILLMGRGENVRDWIHVGDHCTAIEMIIEAALNGREGIVGETFCVGANSEMTNLQVAEELLRLVGKDDSWIDYIPHRLGHDARYAIAASKIEERLGWRPEHTFKEGLRETVQWYRQNEWWWKPLKEGRPNIDPEIQRLFSLSRERK